LFIISILTIIFVFDTNRIKDIGKKFIKKELLPFIKMNKIKNRILLSSPIYQEQRDFWVKHYSSLLASNTFLFKKCYEGKTEHFKIIFPADIWDKYLAITNNNDLSFFIFNQSILKILLHKVYGNRFVSIVSPLYKPLDKKQFNNDRVLLTSAILPEISFKQFLSQEKESVFRVYKNQDYPYTELIKEHGTELEELYAYSPLFVFDSIHDIALLDSDNHNFSFLLKKEESGTVYVYFNNKFIQKPLVDFFGKYYVNILKKVIENPEFSIGEIEIESSESVLGFIRQQYRSLSFDKSISVAEIIEANAIQYQNNIAIEHNGQKVTYFQLNSVANKLANYLIPHLGNNKKIACILLNRGIALIESILSIWKSGAAYIPLDVNDPVKRLSGILKKSGTQVIITMSGLVTQELRDTFAGEIIELDVQQKLIEQQNPKNPKVQKSTNDLAYVIYTSGSTGIPKGVMIEHIGMMNHLWAKIKDLEISEQSIIAQNASHTFDISVWQMMAALLKGGKTIVYSNDHVLHVESFARQIQEDKVTILELVPSYLSVLLELGNQDIPFSNLRHLLLTGETVKPILIKKWFGMYPDIPVVNAYGPTEASDDITHHIMSGYDCSDTISIGMPVYNFIIYIVDQQMKLCAVGVKGEICVSGIGVGRGYLNDKIRTDEVFVPDPFSTLERIKMYKTGDLGSWKPDGTIEFYGRKDYQVKIRGYRIELGEIESKLSLHEEIKEVVVVDRDDSFNNKHLVAYYKSNKELVKNHLDAFLGNYLPSYMCPTFYVRTDRFPINASGKIDRNLLPEHVFECNEFGELPNTETEKKLAQIWAELLEKDSNNIYATSNFFEIGGNSLIATLLVSIINKEFSITIGVESIFELPILRVQGNKIDSVCKSDNELIAKARKKDLYHLSPGQEGLYFLQQFNQDALYNIPLMLKIEGNLDVGRIQHSFGLLVKRHEVLRTSFILKDNIPYQKINNIHGITIEESEISDDGDLLSIQQQFIRPFHLDKVPLLRLGIISVSKKPHIRYLLFDIHHIITDGVSNNIIIKDLIKLYNGDALPELKMQYKDYSEWIYNYKKSEKYSIQKKYWLDQFQNGFPILQLPYNTYPITKIGNHGANFSFELANNTFLRVKQLAGEHNVTPYMFLLTAFTILLSKICDQNDILIGSVNANRYKIEFKNTVGLFVNMMALRFKIEYKKTFYDLLQETKQIFIKALNNQDYRFEDLFSSLKQPYSLKEHPIEVVFQYQNHKKLTISLPKVKIEHIEFYNELIKHKLILTGIETNKGINFIIQYKSRLFKEETIRVIKELYLTMIDKIIETPLIRIHELNVFSNLEIENIQITSTKKFNF
jgi:amino acid adenylation domain-containing protein